MRSRRRGLAQFFGGDEIKPGRNVDAENLCLLRPSKSVNGYRKKVTVHDLHTLKP